MNKEQFKKEIAQNAFYIGIDAKKHFASFNILAILPNCMLLICLAIGIIQVAYHNFLNQKELSITLIIVSVVGFFIKLKSLKRVGLLDKRYKIQADYDLLYRIIIKNNMSGVNTKGNEIFGDLGDSGFSSRHSFLSKLINEIIIRFRNGQNIFYLIYIILGRCFMKNLKPILKNINYK